MKFIRESLAVLVLSHVEAAELRGRREPNLKGAQPLGSPQEGCDLCGDDAGCAVGGSVNFCDKTRKLSNEKECVRYATMKHYGGKTIPTEWCKGTAVPDKGGACDVCGDSAGCAVLTSQENFCDKNDRLSNEKSCVRYTWGQTEWCKGTAVPDKGEACDVCGDSAGCAVLSSDKKFCDESGKLSNEKACVSYWWTPTEWCKGTAVPDTVAACDVCGDSAGCAVLSSHKKFCDESGKLSNEKACVSYTSTPTEWCKGTAVPDKGGACYLCGDSAGCAVLWSHEKFCDESGKLSNEKACVRHTGGPTEWCKGTAVPDTGGACDVCGDSAGCAILSSHEKFCDKTRQLFNERACVTYGWPLSEWCKGTAVPDN